MNIHLIAIGGSVMHQLAIALHLKGNNVTGSDDQIFEPARYNLEKAGILPPFTGWFPEKITRNIDAIILGMHAKEDNPELLKAKQTGLKIFRFLNIFMKKVYTNFALRLAEAMGKPAPPQ